MLEEFTGRGERKGIHIIKNRKNMGRGPQAARRIEEKRKNKKPIEPRDNKEYLVKGKGEFQKRGMGTKHTALY